MYTIQAYAKRECISRHVISTPNSVFYAISGLELLSVS